MWSYIQGGEDEALCGCAFDGRIGVAFPADASRGVVMSNHDSMRSHVGGNGENIHNWWAFISFGCYCSPPRCTSCRVHKSEFEGHLPVSVYRHSEQRGSAALP